MANNSTQKISELNSLTQGNFAALIPTSLTLSDASLATNKITVGQLHDLFNFNSAYATLALALAATVKGQVFHVYTDASKLRVIEYVRTTTGASQTINADGTQKVIYIPSLLKHIKVQVGSFAELRAFKPWYDGQVVSLKEYSAGSGLGGGEFTGSLTTGTDDGGITAVGSGFKWIRSFSGCLHPEFFGAYGVVNSAGLPLVDETSKIEALLAYAGVSSTKVEIVGDQRYLISRTINVFPFLYELDMGQAIFVTAPVFTGSTGVKINGSNAAVSTIAVAFVPNRLRVNVWGPFSPAYGIRHARTIPVSQYTVLDGLTFEGSDVGGSQQITFLEVTCNVWGFRDNIVCAGSHVYGIHFYHPSCRGAYRNGWRFSRVADFGENFQVIGGATAEITNIAGDAKAFYIEKNSNVTLGIYGQSIDYSDFLGRFDSGSISIIDPFFENSSTNPWFLVNYDNDSTGEPTALYIKNQIANRGNRSTTAVGSAYLEPFNGRDCFIKTTGGVIVEVTGQLGRYSDTTSTLVKADTSVNTTEPARVAFDGWVINGSDGSYQGVTYQSRYTNRIYNGRFQTGDLTGVQYTTLGTNVSDSLSVITDTTKSGSRTLDDIGNNALKMSHGTDANSVNFGAHVYFTFPVEPGKQLLTSLQYRQIGTFVGYFVILREGMYYGADGSEQWVKLSETGIYGGTPPLYLSAAHRMRVPEGFNKMRLHLRFYYASGNPSGVIYLKDINAWCS